ncbi:MAG: hypothetical protein H6721_18140 [Sandaracinus sp.]|nr:hypothetical protein [Sandaracinus sp.]MCB9620283.1 hypothetical protein [Sandaracinus sp.]MCB9634044.1 hypothetical protein [Sandaracinus sp.]
MTVVAAHGPFEVERRDGALPTYHLRRDGNALRWDAFARELVDAPALRQVLVDALRSAEPTAYFFECAPWIAGNDPKVEWVLVPTRSFERVKPDVVPFRDLFEPGAAVTTFPNLRGDATLVVPNPTDDLAPYGHLASFVREAPPAQVDALFAAVGQALLDVRTRRRGTLWLNTAGLGVDWLHVRLDSRPKYYRHEPYKSE